MPEHQIKLEDIYDKNINFLIGSGASFGLIPTLAVDMEVAGKPQTIETLSVEIERLDSNLKTRLNALLFMYYYEKCIKPARGMDLETLSESGRKVITNYESLLKTILFLLNKRNLIDKRCNLFTTNYDGCLVLTADKILSEENIDYVINDGTRGFKNKYLQAKNFNSFLRQTGIFSLQHKDIPQINLIHLHGSVYWKKKDQNILVDYSKANNQINIEETFVNDFSALLANKSTTFDQLKAFASSQSSDFDEIAEVFLAKYNALPIVNPTKWKFYETVFEEHYYQMLRAMSYELEKPNTIFITFGFSFADEHILNLVKRSLANPSLQLYICCFNTADLTEMKTKFSGYTNVVLISAEHGNLDFSKFNDSVLSTAKINQISGDSES